MTADGSATVLERLPYEGTARKLLLSALECFSETGYEATTTRDITARAQMSAGSIYVHFPSKSALLLELSRAGYGDVLDIVRDTIADIREPLERAHAMTYRLSHWHAANHTLARVAQYEFRSLDGEALEEITGMRRETEQLVRDVVEEGVTTGRFTVPNINGAARAMLGLSIDIARWYTGNQRTSPESIGSTYADLVVAMLTNDHARTTDTRS